MAPRPVPEWIGKKPTSMPSAAVFDRLFDLQNGICACGCRMLMDRNTDRIVRDHRLPLKDGGENRESNLQLMLFDHHVNKTSAENSGRAEAARWHARAYPELRQRQPRMRGRQFPKAEPQHTASRPIERKGDRL